MPKRSVRLQYGSRYTHLHASVVAASSASKLRVSSPARSSENLRVVEGDEVDGGGGARSKGSKIEKSDKSRNLNLAKSFPSSATSLFLKKMT